MSQDKPKDEQKKYKDTLNLPRTDFPIRPNAAVDDAMLLERWQQEDLYATSFVQNEGSTKYILHDGPPYANGHIHLGHAYNKILKDMVGKSQRMGGKQVPITPGWDCHGLPIELAVSREFPGLSPEALKKQCRAYASKWIDVQLTEFKQLGVLMNWDHPYTTMDYHYEAKILRAFGTFVARGYIEKKKKTVAWCFSCKTVLASAEIEYHERKDPSIYVRFPLLHATKEQYLKQYVDKPISLLVWTTTPWTLPLNRAVLLKPKATYVGLEAADGIIVVARELAATVAAKLQISATPVFSLTAEQLQGKRVQHPFVDGLEVPIILDPFVSLEEGTAAVHCAPGCGPQDYDVALQHDLEVYSPIAPDGTYTEEVEPAALRGMSVTDGQGWVITQLLQHGMLVHKESIRHSYPHCWRCRNGLIFRATNQWFCNLSQHNLRQRALDAVQKINFLPPKARNFLKATIEGRLEWCLSRQRVWGVPIPALLCAHCSHPYISQELIDKVAYGVEREGIEYWDHVALDDLGLEKLACAQCAHTEFTKEKDILDVWFESGVSHYAVLRDNPELAFPADMYVEGLDQHRAWFQSSLLTALVLEEQAPMRSILTHGFTVDQKGHKMSKSLGNVVSPKELIDKLGTDGLRLWVSSIDYDGDAIVSPALLENVSKVYRKIRNTARFLLSNLYDFDKDRDAIDVSDMLLIDRYALEELFQLNYELRVHYASQNFTAVFHGLADYTTVELSSFYLDIIKDRLYAAGAASHERRSAQTVCWYILDTLTKLMAPILSFTAELISDEYQQDKKESIHLQQFNDLPNVWQEIERRSEPPQTIPTVFTGNIVSTVYKLREFSFIAERNHQWQLLRTIRDAVLKALEEQREQGRIKHSLEAQVTIHFAFDGDTQRRLHDFLHDLAASGQQPEEFFKEFFIVSQCSLQPTKDDLAATEVKGLYVRAEPAKGVKCPRCWQFDVSDHPDQLCRRCVSIAKTAT